MSARSSGSSKNTEAALLELIHKIVCYIGRLPSLCKHVGRCKSVRMRCGADDEYDINVMLEIRRYLNATPE